MLLEPSTAWKLAVAIVLGAVILVSAFARAPRKAVPRSELRRLVVAAILLYAAGAAASLTGRTVLAAVVYATGISVCALAAWLSRGSDSDWPPGWDEPEGQGPPPDPDALPTFDWQAFEREFREYASRQQAVHC